MAGRPTDYREEYCEQVEKLCKLGATDEEIADFFGVVESTINLWKLEYSEFSESIKRGKIIADAEVADSLYKRAVGFEYDEVTYEKINMDIDGVEETSDDDLKAEAYKKKLVRKTVPPDVAAQNIWLKNRRGRVKKGAQKWADKVETGFTDNDGNDVPVTIFQLPDNGRAKDNKATGGVSDEGTQQPG